MHPFKLQKLGRWESALVVHYAGEALASGLAHDVMSFARSSDVESSSQELRNLVSQISERLDALEEVSDPADLEDQSVGGRYVRNLETQAVHYTLADPSMPS